MDENNIKLEALAFTFKKQNGELETSIDLLDNIFTELPNFIDLLPNDNKNKRSVKIEKKKIDGNTISSFKKNNIDRIITGKISSTNYGKIIKIIDPGDKDAEPVYQSKPEHGVEKVFFFFIHIPDNNQKGFILLERNGIYGIRTVFCQVLKKFIKDEFPENKINFNDFIDKDLVKRFVKKGTAKSVTLKTDKIPRELSDKLQFLEEEYKDYTISLTIKKKRGSFGSSTKKVIDKLYDTKDKSYLVTENLKTLGFGESSDISTQIKYDGKEKNINFNESFNLKSIYDLTVKLDSYGESDFTDINKKSLDLFKEINPF